MFDPYEAFKFQAGEQPLGFSSLAPQNISPGSPEYKVFYCGQSERELFSSLGKKNSLGIISFVLFGRSPFPYLRYFFSSHICLSQYLATYLRTLWISQVLCAALRGELWSVNCSHHHLPGLLQFCLLSDSTAAGWTLNSPAGSCRAYLVFPLLRARGALLPDTQCLKTISQILSSLLVSDGKVNSVSVTPSCPEMEIHMCFFMRTYEYYND